MSSWGGKRVLIAAFTAVLGGYPVGVNRELVKTLDEAIMLQKCSSSSTLEEFCLMDDGIPGDVVARQVRVGLEAKVDNSDLET